MYPMPASGSGAATRKFGVRCWKRAHCLCSICFIYEHTGREWQRRCQMALLEHQFPIQPPADPQVFTLQIHCMQSGIQSCRCKPVWVSILLVHGKKLTFQVLLVHPQTASPLSWKLTHSLPFLQEVTESLLPFRFWQVVYTYTNWLNKLEPVGLMGGGPAPSSTWPS